MESIDLSLNKVITNNGIKNMFKLKKINLYFNRNITNEGI